MVILNIILITATLQLISITIALTPPYFGNVSEAYTFAEGDNARISCPSFLGEPPGRMFWVRNRDFVNTHDGSNYVLHKDQSLEIQSIQLNDSGVYQCYIVSSVYGSIFSDITVNVNASGHPGAPIIDKSNFTRRTFAYSDTINLTCNVVSGVQPITYQWSVNGIIVTNNMPHLNRQSQNSSYADTDLSGEYKCIATNIIGSDTFAININVNVPPLPSRIYLSNDQYAQVDQHGQTAILQYQLPFPPLMITQLSIEWNKEVNGELVPVQLGSRITQSFLGWLTISDTQVSDAACNTGAVRLAGGYNAYEGRVEVCQNSMWRTVCDTDEWSTSTADVACTQAGFPFTIGSLIVRNHTYGGDNDSILLTNINCDGSDLRLLDCTEFGDTPTQCTSGDSVGIQCPICATGDIQIVQINDRSEPGQGRVEVYTSMNTMSTICLMNDDTSWDAVNAGVACVQAGFAFEGAQPVPIFNTSATNEHSLVDVFCRGTEKRLIDCDYFTNRELRLDFDGLYCSNFLIAGVRCQPRPPTDPPMITTEPTMTSMMTSTEPVTFTPMLTNIPANNVPTVSTYVITGAVSSAIAVVLVCFLLLCPIVKWYLKKRRLNQRNLEDNQDHIYEAVDDLQIPPLPPIRAQGIGTMQNIAYRLPPCNTFELHDHDLNNGCDNDCSPQNSIANVFPCANDLDDEVIIENPIQTNMADSDQDHTEENNHCHSDDISPHVQSSSQNPLDQDRQVLDYYDQIQPNVPVPRHSSDYSQVQPYELIGSYEAIGGYERIRIPHIGELAQLSHGLALQNEHHSNNVEVANSQNPPGIHDNNDERNIAVSQPQDSGDYDQMQGCGGYEAIGGYERIRIPRIGELAQLSHDLALQNEHHSYCNNVEVADSQNPPSIHDNNDEGNIVVSQTQDSGDYDQIQGYELIGGYEAIGGYERAPFVDIDHLPHFTSNSTGEQAKDCSGDNIDTTERQNPSSLGNVSNDQDYDQIQPYERVPRLQDSDIAHSIAQFGRHNERLN